MTRTAAPDRDTRWTVDEITRRLHHFGYTHLRDDHGHRLLARGAERVVLPVDEEIPEPTVRAIESLREDRLGQSWLRGDGSESDEPEPHRDVRVRVEGTVVLRGSVWLAFLPREPSVVTFGPSFDEAADRLRAATALWFDVPPDAVTVDVVRVANAS